MNLKKEARMKTGRKRTDRKIERLARQIMVLILADLKTAGKEKSAGGKAAAGGNQ